jgi:hypothetical protein
MATGPDMHCTSTGYSAYAAMWHMTGTGRERQPAPSTAAWWPVWGCGSRCLAIRVQVYRVMSMVSSSA